MRTLVLAILAVILVTSPASARCMMSYCKDATATVSPAPSTSWAITNQDRQRIGDIYNPGHGRRLQIRDTSRRIIGYIERDGDITDKRRRKVGEIEELLQ